MAAMAVSDPWPISTVLVNTFTLPSSLSLMAAHEMDGVMVALISAASPLPRTLEGSSDTGAGSLHFISWATFSRHSLTPMLQSFSPVTNSSPSS